MPLRHCLAFLFLSLFLLNPAAAQRWGLATGLVTDADDGTPLPGVSVVVAGTNFGTATDQNGEFEFRLPEGDYILRFSSIGYEPQVDSVYVRADRRAVIEVELASKPMELGEITVESERNVEDAGVYRVDPEKARAMPTPVKDAIRSLKVLPGVATNNELSNQYSVRGGGFNENLILLNGFEVFLPFRPRQGEQEGLSLLNAELADRMQLYTGGFPARYGGKLSSALNVTYMPPQNETVQGSAYGSMLDAGVQASAGMLDGKLGVVLGARRSYPGRFFGTQQLKGYYQPDFGDVQLLASYDLSPGHTLEALGIVARNEFFLEPTNRRVNYGLAITANGGSDLKSLFTDFEGEQRSGYVTQFGGVRLTSQFGGRWTVSHDVALFQTAETEFRDIAGASDLLQVNTAGDPLARLGSSQREDEADNRVAVRTLTGKGRYRYTVDRHAAEAGWQLRHLTFEDRLDEKSTLTYQCQDQSDGFLRECEDKPLGADIRFVTDSLKADASLESWQAGGYLQDAVDVLPRKGQLVVTGGLRADYFDFNDQFTLSPRLSARYEWTTRTVFVGSWGVYHQPATYRELRGEPDSTFSLGDLNRDIQAQRSTQYVFGVEHFLPERRFYLRAEAYYKDLDHLISYSVEDVRVEYSGDNDAEGYAYGLDLQLRGEFVPGLESWANYSYLRTDERFTTPEAIAEHGEEYIPRPADQRHTFSLFVQDYVPENPTWKLHMRFLYGSGLPYTPLIPEEREDGLQVQAPGDRNSSRLPDYRRVDFGVTKEITVFDRGITRPVRLELTGEVLNIFDMTNVVAYSWEGRDFSRIPKRLTPRTFNVRLRLEF